MTLLEEPKKCQKNLTHRRGCNINFLTTQDAGLAQSVEQRTENPRVHGHEDFQSVEQRTENPRVRGSIPDPHFNTKGLDD